MNWQKTQSPWLKILAVFGADEPMSSVSAQKQSPWVETVSPRAHEFRHNPKKGPQKLQNLWAPSLTTVHISLVGWDQGAVKEKVQCYAPNSVKNLVMHRIRWQIQHCFFHSAEKSMFFNDYFITEFGDDLLATNSSRNPVMKINLFSFVSFWVTELSAYVCTEVDENDFCQDFSTKFSEKLCASLNFITN